MKTSSFRGLRLVVVCVILAGAAVVADSIRFSDFTSLPSSAPPTLDESAPISFGNPLFQQRSVANRAPDLLKERKISFKIRPLSRTNDLLHPRDPRDWNRRIHALAFDIRDAAPGG